MCSAVYLFMVLRGLDVIFLFPVMPYDGNVIIYILQSWGTFVDKGITEWSRFNSWEREREREREREC